MKCAPATIPSNIIESVGKFTWPNNQPASLLKWFHNKFQHYLRTCTILPCFTRYESVYMLSLRLNMTITDLFSCMTHPHSWFGFQMTHPFRTARPIRTVAGNELSTLRLNLQLLRNFLSMLFERINSHMYHYEVTHRDIETHDIWPNVNKPLNSVWFSLRM